MQGCSHVVCMSFCTPAPMWGGTGACQPCSTNRQSPQGLQGIKILPKPVPFLIPALGKNKYRANETSWNEMSIKRTAARRAKGEMPSWDRFSMGSQPWEQHWTQGKSTLQQPWGKGRMIVSKGFISFPNFLFLGFVTIAMCQAISPG